MESMGKTASPCLSVPEIQTAQLGQVGLSCLLQLPGKSLGLTSTRTENLISPGHGRDLQHDGWSARLLQSKGTSNHKMKALLFERDVCLPCHLPALPLVKSNEPRRAGGDM